MRISYGAFRGETPVFRAFSSFHEKEALKAAGFWWDPERRFWWTTSFIAPKKLLGACDEAARRAIEAAEEQVTASAAVSTAATKPIPLPPGKTLLPFQVAGVLYIAQRQVSLLADEMGLGKTLQAIAACNVWGEQERIERILVISPKSVLLMWRQAWTEWSTLGLSPWVVGRNSVPKTLDGVIIINYDAIKKYPQLWETQWHVVIFDECHYLKNPKAQRTQLCLGGRGSEGLRARRQLFLTGTPIMNRPIELWPIIRRAKIGMSWKYYVTRYCEGEETQYGWSVSGASNLDELQERLRATIMIRRTKKEVLSSLPPKRRQVIEISNCGAGTTAIRKEKAAIEEQAEVLAALRAEVEIARAAEDSQSYREAVGRLQAGVRTAFTQIAKARYETALAKLPVLIPHLMDLAEEGQLVVFAHHREIISRIVEAAREAGVSAEKITGETPLVERQRVVDDFQQGEIRMLVASIQAAGVGLTLTAASVAVFAELDWVPANISQAEDRLHRIGQDDSVLIQHIVLAESLDATMAHALVRKQQVLEAALDRGGAEAEIESKIPVLPIESDFDSDFTAQEEEEKEEEIDAKTIASIHQGLRRLASVCDGARTVDGRGFNKIDTHIGHALAQLSQLTPKQAALGRKILRKYSRQLKEGE